MTRSEQFPTTHWSVLVGLREAGPAGAAALERLCSVYWYPLYAFARREGRTPENAEDLVQSFFADLVTGDALKRVDPLKGRFRSYLLGGLKRHMAEETRREFRQKRRPPGGWLAWDAVTAEERYAQEPVIGETPETLYERAWGWALLDSVLARLREEFEIVGKTRLFELLAPHLTADDNALPHAEIAVHAGMTPGAVRVAVLRLRARMARLLREELARSVADEAEIEAELKHLASVWS